MVTFTATVTANPVGGGTPTGIVTFVDGSTAIGTGTISAGVATFTTSVLAVVSTHSIKAFYGGDANFNAGISAALPYTVNQAASATVAASSANPSVIGQTVTLSANVAASAPGSGLPTRAP